MKGNPEKQVKAQISKNLWICVCDAVSHISTDDRKWVSHKTIQTYIQDVYDLDTQLITSNLSTTLKRCVAQGLLRRKGSSYSFCSKKVVQEIQQTPVPKKKKKKRKEEPRKLSAVESALEVYVTATGRVSVKHKYD